VYENLSNRIRRDEAGFTLVELLVVVIILGILAAIVVFSVRGLNDKSQEAACSADLTILMTAQETNFAEHGTWLTDQDDLMAAGYLAERSVLYSIKPPVAPSTTYSFDRLNTDCPAPPPPA
jgi:general secretion pathway protein G